MKILSYWKTVILGLLGLLITLRGVENILFGGELKNVLIQIVVGVLLLYAAWKARPQPKTE